MTEFLTNLNYALEDLAQTRLKIAELEAIKRTIELNIADLCPIKRGWIVKKEQVRIRVGRISYRDHSPARVFVLTGQVMTKKNEPHRTWGSGSIVVLIDDNGSVHHNARIEIISKGENNA